MRDSNGPRSASQPILLSTDDARPPRRADAKRNYERILAVTRRLVADRGLDEVSTAEIAAAAGVGKGSVFRAFGDKAGIARALLDDDERRLQEHILTGPPPVGPGAPPAERVAAFAAAYCGFLERNAPLVLVSDAHPLRRYEVGAQVGWQMHVTALVRSVEPDGDAEATASAVLALLTPERYLYAVTGAGWSHDRFTTTTVEAVRRLTSPIRRPENRRGRRTAGTVR
jgi:AcrR family transcriptional regulator